MSSTGSFLHLLITIFLFQFVFLDSYLSFQFLNWDIISSNYFFQVDSIIWQLNWPLPVKFMNSGLATIILVFTDLTAIALLLEFRQFSKTRKSQIAHLHLNNHISSCWNSRNGQFEPLSNYFEPLSLLPRLTSGPSRRNSAWFGQRCRIHNRAKNHSNAMLHSSRRKILLWFLPWQGFILNNWLCQIKHPHSQTDQCGPAIHRL